MTSLFKFSRFISKYFLLMIANLVLLNTTHAEIISQNLMVKHSDIQMVENYSTEKMSGRIRVKSCSGCEKQELILDGESIFLFQDHQLEMNALLYTLLRYPSKQVRIQFNQRDKTVSYIRWMPNDDQEKGLL